MRTCGRGVLFWAFVMVLLASLGVQSWRRRGSSGPVAAVPLPGGTGERLVVWKAGVGTQEALVLGRFARLDPLRALLPGWAPWLGRPTWRLEASTEVPSLTLFYSITPGKDGLQRGPDYPWALDFLDRHGCRLRGLEGSGIHPSLRGTYYHQAHGCFPRRDRSFIAEFGGESTPPRPLRVVLTNPATWEGREWVADPLPARGTAGDGGGEGGGNENMGEFLQVDLTGWEETGGGVAPRFRFLESGVESRDWELKGTMYRDATRNRSIEPTLCRYEPAWRCDAWFGRRLHALMASSNRWELGRSAVFPAGEWEAGGREVHPGGAVVRLVALGGPGTFRFTLGADWKVVGAGPELMAGLEHRLETRGAGAGMTAEYRAESAWVALEIPGMLLAGDWQVVAVDEQGRAHGTTERLMAGVDLHLCGVALPGDVREATWVLVHQRLISRRFTVAPPPPSLSAAGGG